MEVDGFVVSYEEVHDAQQFWDELHDLVGRDQSTPRLVEQAVRSYLSFAAMFRDEYLLSEEDVARCCYLLLGSPLFLNHKGFVRRRLCSHFVNDSRNSRACYLIAFLLIFDGKSYHKTLELLLSEGAFPLLCFLIMQSRSIDARLHTTLLDLLYEMCRIQRLALRDLAGIDESFVSFLFGLVETSMEDEEDVGPIKAILVLNEQYMVAAHAELPEGLAEEGESREPIPNKVLYLLGTAGFAFKTFAEKIILMINRERDMSLQLLILKLLFLLFTTPETYEYFYYNDLRVLVDVFIRELYDIADDSEPLRHTYLRVLYPLLAHTQLRHAPHYKRTQLLHLLKGLILNNQYRPVNPTTQRLVKRCFKVVWLQSNFAKPEDYDVQKLLPHAHNAPELVSASPLPPSPKSSSVANDTTSEKISFELVIADSIVPVH